MQIYYIPTIPMYFFVLFITIKNDKKFEKTEFIMHFK